MHSREQGPQSSVRTYSTHTLLGTVTLQWGRGEQGPQSSVHTHIQHTLRLDQLYYSYILCTYFAWTSCIARGGGARTPIFPTYTYIAHTLLGPVIVAPSCTKLRTTQRRGFVDFCGRKNEQTEVQLYVYRLPESNFGTSSLLGLGKVAYVTLM